MDFPNLNNFKLKDCCYDTLSFIKNAIENVPKLIKIIFPCILFTKFFSHPMMPIKASALNGIYTITTNDWVQLAQVIQGLNAISRAKIFHTIRGEINSHLLSGEQDQVKFWEAMQKCFWN